MASRACMCMFAQHTFCKLFLLVFCNLFHAFNHRLQLALSLKCVFDIIKNTDKNDLCHFSPSQIEKVQNMSYRESHGTKKVSENLTKMESVKIRIQCYQHYSSWSFSPLPNRSNYFFTFHIFTYSLHSSSCPTYLSVQAFTRAEFLSASLVVMSVTFITKIWARSCIITVSSRSPVAWKVKLH